MSQCQCLSVTSRWNRGRADIAAYSWDLAHIQYRWEILPMKPAMDWNRPFVQPIKDTIGTVVLWQRLDRILGYKHPYGETAQRSQMCRETELHLGMVFHRFLSGEVRRKRLKILLSNGNEVKPWDPFCRSEKKTKELQSITIPLNTKAFRAMCSSNLLSYRIKTISVLLMLGVRQAVRRNGTSNRVFTSIVRDE